MKSFQLALLLYALGTAEAFSAGSYLDAIALPKCAEPIKSKGSYLDSLAARSVEDLYAAPTAVMEPPTADAAGLSVAAPVTVEQLYAPEAQNIVPTLDAVINVEIREVAPSEGARVGPPLGQATRKSLHDILMDMDDSIVMLLVK